MKIRWSYADGWVAGWLAGWLADAVVATIILILFSFFSKLVAILCPSQESWLKYVERGGDIVDQKKLSKSLTELRRRGQ